MKRTEAAPALLFELDRTLEFLSSVALTRVLAEACSPSWQTYDDGLFLNAVDTLVPAGGRAGTLAKHLTERAGVRTRYDQIYRRMVDLWMEMMQAGPEEVARFLSRLEQIREREGLHLEETSRDTPELDDEIAADLTEAVRRGTQVTLGATIAVAGGSAGATLLTAMNVEAVGVATAQAAARVNVGAMVSAAVITQWEDAAGAKIIGVSTEANKFSGHALTGHLGNRWMMDTAEAMHEQVRRHCLAKMKQMQQVFLRAIRYQGPGVTPTGPAVESAASGMKLKIGVAVFFAALDVVQAIERYLEE